MRVTFTKSDLKAHARPNNFQGFRGSPIISPPAMAPRSAYQWAASFPNSPNIYSTLHITLFWEALVTCIIPTVVRLHIRIFFFLQSINIATLSLSLKPFELSHTALLSRTPSTTYVRPFATHITKAHIPSSGKAPGTFIFKILHYYQ